MGKRLLSRRVLAAVGVLAAGVFSGCQSGGGHYVHAGVARGDLAGNVPTSPAFAQVNAGRNLPMAQANGGMMMASGSPTMSGMPSNQTMVSGPPIVGSGGMVYPVGYTPNGPNPMPATPASMPMTTSMPVQGMPMQTAQMPMQSMPMQSMPMQGMPMQGVPMQGMPAMTPTPGATGTPTLMVIQGPNGPQYMITEVISSTPLPPGSTAVPTSMLTPTSSTPVMMVPAPSTPVMTAAPTPAPVHELVPPAPEPVPPAAPTFNPPPPATIPMPSMSPAPPTEVSFKAPNTLPPTVGAKPTGPVLPASGSSGPGLGSFPATPAVTPAGGPKLPPASAVSDDDIPPAPVFLPGGK